MVQWRSNNQEEIDGVWKKLSVKVEEEVLETCKVEVSKKGACKGRGEPSEWKIVQRVKKHQPGKW